MGNRGPKPTPTAILEKQGSRRGRKAEPRPLSSMPEKPFWLREKAAACWDDLGPTLVSWGILTELDGLVFGMLCESVVRWLDCRALATKEGPFATGKNGAEYQHPAVTMENQSWNQLVKIAREFGLSPSSRSALRIDGKPGGTVGKLDEFFKPKIARTPDRSTG